MSSRTSSRSTLTMVPSTMSPSLKYLMVLSTAARKSSAVPMSLIATCCVGALAAGTVVVSVDIRWVAPVRMGVVGGHVHERHASSRTACGSGVDVGVTVLNNDGGGPIPDHAGPQAVRPTARAVSYASSRLHRKFVAPTRDDAAVLARSAHELRG